MASDPCWAFTVGSCSVAGQAGSSTRRQDPERCCRLAGLNGLKPLSLLTVSTTEAVTARASNDTLQVNNVHVEALLCHFLNKKLKPPKMKAHCFLLFSFLDMVVRLGGATIIRGPRIDKHGHENHYIKDRGVEKEKEPDSITEL